MAGNKYTKMLLCFYSQSASNLVWGTHINIYLLLILVRQVVDDEFVLPDLKCQSQSMISTHFKWNF